MNEIGTSEFARAGGKASAKVRAERAALTAAQRAQVRLERQAERLVDLVVAAASGEAPFEELPVKERATMAKFALEQILGRPGQRAEAPKDPEAPEAEGLRFATREIRHDQTATPLPFPGATIS